MTDPLEFLASLPANGPGYTDMDRYRDFRKVLMGSDEGKRVLREILSWGHMFKPPVHGRPIDPLAMAIDGGERNMALRLLATVNQEPPERPQRARQQQETT